MYATGNSSGWPIPQGKAGAEPREDGCVSSTDGDRDGTLKTPKKAVLQNAEIIQDEDMPSMRS